MTTLEELNRDCPEHDRTSCSDAHPINAGIDYRHGTVWCRRCEGLHQLRLAAAAAVPAGWVAVPRTLTAENGAKAALMGETFEGQAVPWTAVKAVHKAIVAWADKRAAAQAERAKGVKP